MVFFWHRKQERDWVVQFTKVPVNFSLSLDLKPGTGNANKEYRKFRSFRQKREKGNTSKGITFSRKFPPGWSSISSLPGISGFSIQMVSLPDHKGSSLVFFWRLISLRMCRTHCKCSAWVYDQSAQKWELDHTCKFLGLCQGGINSK